jgi:hypothetical protein
VRFSPGCSLKFNHRRATRLCHSGPLCRREACRAGGVGASQFGRAEAPFANLTPASRRQDPLQRCSSASAIRVHRIPRPTSVTIAKCSSEGERGAASQEVTSFLRLWERYGLGSSPPNRGCTGLSDQPNQSSIAVGSATEKCRLSRSKNHVSGFVRPSFLADHFALR